MAEPNPIRGIWYAASREPLPYVMNGDEVYHHHLVREGLTIDCAGWLVDRWYDEHSELVVTVSLSELET